MAEPSNPPPNPAAAPPSAGGAPVIPEVLPLLPLSDLVVFPQMVVPLLVTSDNDFLPDNPSVFYAFAIDATDLNYQPQVVVPLPASLCLLASGLLGLAAWKRVGTM